MHFVRLPARLSVIGWLLCCVMSFTSHAGSSSTGTAVERITAGKLEDRVLLTLQAGMTAMDEGDLQLAGQLFDDALEGITAVYGNSEQAARARGLWQNEQSKIYKGEPYERSMAHYYRGLLDLMAGDYDNARASFRGGLLQDAFAEEGQHRADFALLVFLDAWCSQQLGDEALANESYAELEGLRPGFQRPPADHRILVIGETGRAPRKLQDGIGGNKLVYRRGKRIEEESVQLRLGSGQKLSLDKETRIRA